MRATVVQLLIVLWCLVLLEIACSPMLFLYSNFSFTNVADLVSVCPFFMYQSSLFITKKAVYYPMLLYLVNCGNCWDLPLGQD